MRMVGPMVVRMVFWMVSKKDVLWVERKAHL